jgi:hypothetical protein
MAEYPNSFGPLGPGDERIETDRFTLCLGAGKRWNTVQRQRFGAGAVDEVLHEVRSLRARGRGAYRGLLRARWDEAAARETPALMTEAGAMSCPILERLGFEPVGHVHMLLDGFGQIDG